MSSGHSSLNTLIGLATGRSQAAPREIRHAQACPICQREIAALATIVDDLAAGARRTPDRSAIERAVRATRGIAPRLVRTASLIADLDDHSAESPAALRDASPPAHQWLFRAGDLEVDLQAVAHGPESFRLLGQVTGRGIGQGLPVHVSSVSLTDLTTTDTHGEFSIGPIADRAVTLVVETEDEAVQLDVVFEDRREATP